MLHALSRPLQKKRHRSGADSLSLLFQDARRPGGEGPLILLRQLTAEPSLIQQLIEAVPLVHLLLDQHEVAALWHLGEIGAESFGGGVPAKAAVLQNHQASLREEGERLQHGQKLVELDIPLEIAVIHAVFSAECLPKAPFIGSL